MERTQDGVRQNLKKLLIKSENSNGPMQDTPLRDVRGHWKKRRLYSID